MAVGLSTQALQRNQDAITLARELSQPWLLAWVLDYSAVIYQLRGEEQLTQKEAETALALAREQGFVHVVIDATILRGWSLVEQGQGEEGIAQVRQCKATLQIMGAELARTYSLALLAEGYRRIGQVEEGLRTLDEALELVNKHDEHFYEAELYRLKGELLLAQASKSQNVKCKTQKSKPADAQSSPFPQAPSLKPQAPSGVEQEVEGLFLTAINVARHQQAKSLELRAVISLVRLRQQQAQDTQSGTQQTQHGAGSLKLTRCYTPCITGSPKGSTPRTCKKLRHF